MATADAVRVLYIRHGESEVDTDRRLSCRLADGPLTAVGREQAEALGRSLRELGWTFHAEVPTSPLQRAAETAKILAAALDLTVAPDERLRDIDVGRLDGEPVDAVREEYTEIQRRWAAGEMSRSFPEGESFRSLLQRLREALLDAAAAPGRTPGYGYGDIPPTVLVVGHAVGFRCALPQLINNVSEAYPWDDMRPAHVSALSARPVIRPSGLRLDAWNVPASELHRLDQPPARRW